jgi:hypothetical protein
MRTFNRAIFEKETIMPQQQGNKGQKSSKMPGQRKGSAQKGQQPDDKQQQPRKEQEPQKG